jgi:hypothetical protein
MSTSLHYKDGDLDAGFLTGGMPEEVSETFLKMSISSLMNRILDTETVAPGLFDEALNQLTRFLEANENWFMSKNCLDSSHVAYLVSLTETSESSTMKPLLDLITVGSRIPSVCAMFLECGILERLFDMIERVSLEFANPLFLAMNHFCDAFFSENPGAIEDFRFDIFQGLGSQYRIDVLNLFISISKHINTVEAASQFVLHMLNPEPNASTASRIAWIMYYLVSGPLGRNIGILNVLVLLIDHPMVAKLRRNLFWKMNAFLCDANPAFLKPYVQFLFLAISGTGPSDILTYVATSLGVSQLIGLATTKDSHVSLFALKILEALGRKGFWHAREFVGNEENSLALHNIIGNAPIKCRLEALSVLAEIVHEVSPHVACMFLEPALIQTYTDVVSNAAPRRLIDVLRIVIVLLWKVESLEEVYRSASQGFAETDFLSLLRGTIEDTGMNNEVVIALASRLYEEIGRDEQLN